MGKNAPRLTRRELVTTSLGMMGTAALPGTVRGAARVPDLPGRLKQAVCRWPFADLPLDTLCRLATDLGMVAIDLLPPDDWPRVRDLGLVCSMGTPTTRRDFIARGFNDPANHPLLLGELETAIPLAASHGMPNVIAMVGNRTTRSDEEAIAQCVAGLSVIAPLAEEHRVTICLEMLNSKVDHKGFQGDRTAFGLGIVQGVGSPRVKLLYDIYHMQIMEGDVIRTIRDHREHIAHFHTAGVPGRHELDPSQELNYPGIAAAIADLGFTGYLAHEFLPTRPPADGLREAVAACTV
jgi:hydroxypyruvate isomerase